MRHYIRPIVLRRIIQLPLHESIAKLSQNCHDELGAGRQGRGGATAGIQWRHGHLPESGLAEATPTAAGLGIRSFPGI